MSFDSNLNNKKSFSKFSTHWNKVNKRLTTLLETGLFFVIIATSPVYSQITGSTTNKSNDKDKNNSCQPYKQSKTTTYLQKNNEKIADKFVKKVTDPITYKAIKVGKWVAKQQHKKGHTTGTGSTTGLGKGDKK